MLYALIKIPVRLALRIFCKNIHTAPSAVYRRRGPLLVIANHPDSFLDAVIIGSRFSLPVHFLARGDAFTKPWHRKLLGWLNMVPVYRLSEGKENLGLNEYAFRRCREILHAKGIVLIFIEGICVNSHILQPFRKGAARIAWENRNLAGFSVIPLGIAYSNLHGIGKSVNLSAGNILQAEPLFPYPEEPKNMRHFNNRMLEQLQPLIRVPSPQSNSKTTQTWLSMPAALGYVIHILPYILIRNIISQKTKGTVFYDSVLFAVLLLIYPPYLLLVGLCLFYCGVPFPYIFAILAILPFLAKAAIHGKKWKLQ